MKKYKAVLFDMDGVIVNSEPRYLERKLRFFEAENLGITREILRSYGGSDMRYLLDNHFKDRTQEERDQIRTRYAAFSKANKLAYGSLINEGVKETLEYLKQNGYGRALVTSSSRENIQKALSDCGIEDAFDRIISGVEFPKSKPDPAIYNHAKAELGFADEEYLVVEDSNLGIAAAKAAGLFVAAKKDDFFCYDQSRADIIIEKIPDILQFFKPHE